MKKYILLALLSVVLLLGIALPVWAITDPDDPPGVEILGVKVFQSIWEEDDQLYIVWYNVPYGTTPTEPTEETYVMQIYSADMSTVLRQVSLKYYNEFFAAVYCDPSDILVWGTAYNIRVGGNPTVAFPGGIGVTEYIRSLSPSDWIANSPSGYSTEYLSSYITYIAGKLDEAWAGAGLDSLLTDDNKLSAFGAITFSLVIPGLIDIIPDTFETSVEMAEFTLAASTDNSTLQQILGATGNTSAQLEEAFDDLGDWMGIPGGILGASAMGLFFFILTGRITVATGSVAIAITASVPIILLGMMLGLVPVVFVWIMVILVLLVFAIVFILGRLA